MKTTNFIATRVALSIVAALTIAVAFSATAMGFLPPEHVLEANATETMPKAIDDADSAKPASEENTLEPLPQQHVVGEVSYISGGIGLHEASQLKSIAKNYPLEIVCIQKNNQVEEYIAEVKLQIKNAKGNTVLNITTDGPILLAHLPNGKYTISAEYNKVIKTNWVRIDAKKHQKVVFWWPIAE